VLEEEEAAAKKLAKEEKLRKKQEKYMQDLAASGLTEKEYKDMLEKREKEQREALKAKLTKWTEKRQQEKAQVERIRDEKRKRPDYDEYNFDESPIEELDGKDFVKVVELSAEEEEALVLKMQVQDLTSPFLD